MKLLLGDLLLLGQSKVDFLENVRGSSRRSLHLADESIYFIIGKALLLWGQIGLGSNSKHTTSPTASLNLVIFPQHLLLFLLVQFLDSFSNFTIVNRPPFGAILLWNYHHGVICIRFRVVACFRIFALWSTVLDGRFWIIARHLTWRVVRSLLGKHLRIVFNLALLSHDRILLRLAMIVVVGSRVVVQIWTETLYCVWIYFHICRLFVHSERLLNLELIVVSSLHSILIISVVAAIAKTTVGFLRILLHRKSCRFLVRIQQVSRRCLLFRLGLLLLLAWLLRKMLLAHMRISVGFSLISLIFNKLLAILAVSFLWRNYSRMIRPILLLERPFWVKIAQTSQFTLILGFFCHRACLLRSTCW